MGGICFLFFLFFFFFKWSQLILSILTPSGKKESLVVYSHVWFILKWGFKTIKQVKREEISEETSVYFCFWGLKSSVLLSIAPQHYTCRDQQHKRWQEQRTEWRRIKSTKFSSRAELVQSPQMCRQSYGFIQTLEKETLYKPGALFCHQPPSLTTVITKRTTIPPYLPFCSGDCF